MREESKNRFMRRLELLQENRRSSWRGIVRSKAFWIVVLLFIFLFSSGYRFSPYSPDLKAIQAGWEGKYQLEKGSSERGKPSLKQSKSEIQSLKKKLKRLMPRGKYIVIDSIHNRLYLRAGKRDILDAVCSAGSGAILVDTPGGRKWVFDTPRGEFHILNKKENPVWTKPDWAFIEEGEPIPHSISERKEYGVLGEYALYFSHDGYLIHGTLYERLLGRSVTHGCIRLGREDLRILYHSAPLGTKVYIY
jgi:L,D-transpeptidase YbiS